ncbi:ethanolamine ammonia-lyase subunit EutC [Pradoshia sp.]
MKQTDKELQRLTPARIAVGRAGVRAKTDAMLSFRYDHAAAVDAVYGEVNERVLSELGLFQVNTLATEKDVYLRRPDYGRKLSREAVDFITKRCIKGATVQIVVSNGLSANAINENAIDLYEALKQSLELASLDIGTSFYVEKGRVAVMDHIGEILEPKVVVLLIGERPGLMSAESMSVYLCYKPNAKTIESDRMVISNIHQRGTNPSEAGAHLADVIQKVLHYEASGIQLVEIERQRNG